MCREAVWVAAYSIHSFLSPPPKMALCCEWNVEVLSVHLTNRSGFSGEGLLAPQPERERGACSQILAKWTSQRFSEMYLLMRFRKHVLDIRCAWCLSVYCNSSCRATIISHIFSRRYHKGDGIIIAQRRLILGGPQESKHFLESFNN